MHHLLNELDADAPTMTLTDMYQTGYRPDTVLVKGEGPARATANLAVVMPRS